MSKRVRIYEVGDMWSAWEESDLFLITTNGSFTASGKLVMGRGIARQARDRFPGLDAALAKTLRVPSRRYGLPCGMNPRSDCGLCSRGIPQGLLVSPRWPEAKLGLFQVKLRYWEDADLELIRLSTEMLLAWLKEHPDQRVDLNFPGIGCGKLSLDVVRPIIEVPPSSVHIWQKGVEARNG